MKLEVIVHCWAGQLDQYAHFLRYQLSSLLLHPPQQVEVTWTVCFSLEDSLTVDVLKAFL